tara:strand:- start:413 stop:670 length:258 start_codon:yes stop_codon:yes gene_type:complete
MKIEIDEDLRNFFIKEALKELLDEVEKQYVGSNRTKKLYKLKQSIVIILNEINLGDTFNYKDMTESSKKVTINNITKDEEIYTNT